MVKNSLIINLKHSIIENGIIYQYTIPYNPSQNCLLKGLMVFSFHQQKLF